MYEADGFSFPHPDDWRVTSTGSGNLQQYRLTPSVGNGVIIISSPNIKVVYYRDFSGVTNQTAEEFYDKILARFNASQKAVVTDQCENVHGLVVPGRRITGSYDNVPSTADFSYFAVKKRFFSVVALRDNKLNREAETALRLFNKTIAVKGAGNIETDFMIDAIEGGVSKGQAILLPEPIYEVTSRPGFYDQRIRIPVVIDESGNVVATNRVTQGNVLYEGKSKYLGPSLVAARKAKFPPPTLCGRPARMNGILEFVYRN